MIESLHLGHMCQECSGAVTLQLGHYFGIPQNSTKVYNATPLVFGGYIDGCIIFEEDIKWAFGKF